MKNICKIINSWYLIWILYNVTMIHLFNFSISKTSITTSLEGVLQHLSIFSWIYSEAAVNDVPIKTKMAPIECNIDLILPDSEIFVSRNTSLSTMSANRIFDALITATTTGGAF